MIAELILFIQKQADFSEVRAIMNNSIFVHALSIHEINFTADNKMHSSWHLIWMFNDRRFLDLVIQNIIFVFILVVFFILVMSELGANKDFSLKFSVAIFETESKDIVVILKDVIIYLVLQSWL